MDRLRTFYAVTTTSLYRIEEIGGLWHRRPTVIKLACSGWSVLKAGDDLAGSVEKSGRLAVTKRGLHVVVKFDDESWDIAWSRMRNSTTGVALKTSPIVGMFLDYEEALACLHAADRQIADPRWSARTAEVIAAIGNRHPVFFVPPDADFPGTA